MADETAEQRIARIKTLLDDLAEREEDARQEILVAIEQLLAIARDKHDGAVRQHREIHARLADLKAERDAWRRRNRRK